VDSSFEESCDADARVANASFMEKVCISVVRAPAVLRGVAGSVVSMLNVTAVLVTVVVDISKVQILVPFVPGQIPVRGISIVVVHKPGCDTLVAGKHEVIGMLLNCSLTVDKPSR
jgi:hypothetical protein